MRTMPARTNRRVVVSQAVLHELYVTQKLTIEQIAARFGLSATTIARRFADVGIVARRRGPLPGMWPRVPLDCNGEQQWTAELAYAVGLITTDGCLSQDGRRLTMTSEGFRPTRDRPAVSWCHRSYHVEHEPSSLLPVAMGRRRLSPVAYGHRSHAGKESPSRPMARAG